MRPIRSIAITLGMLLLTVSLLPLATAHESPAAIQAFVADEAAAASADPVSYIDGNASADGLDRYEAEVAKLACLATLDLEDATGQDIPEDLDPCPVLADAIGAAPDEADAQAPAAAATPLDDETAERIDAYAEELAADIDALIADPTSAPTRVASIVDRTLALIGHLITGLGTGLLAMVVLPLTGAGTMGLRGLEMINAGATATMAAAALPVQGALATGDAISGAIAAANDAARDRSAATADAMTRTLDGIASWVGALFGVETPTTSSHGTEAAAPTSSATDTAMGLVDHLTETRLDTTSVDA